MTLPLTPDDTHEKETHNEQEWDELIPPPMPSSFEGVAKLWKSLQPIILQGLRHGVKEEEDGGGDGEDWIKELLERVLTPHVLEYSIKGMPHTSILKSMAAKLARRIRHLSSNTTTTTTTSTPHSIPEGPLKILVFGGSVVEGTGCDRRPSSIPGRQTKYESLRECAWPFRLEVALNHLLRQMWLVPPGTTIDTDAFPLVHIYNLATGGTNSEAAVPILQYGLSPTLQPDSPPPDVIINAYSANDNLPPAFHATKNTTTDSFHLARVWKRTMDFVAAAQHSSKQQTQSSSCSSHGQVNDRDNTPPFILFVNDYLGNQQESILGESSLDQAIQWITDFDETVGYVSVSHSVRRWVLADTSEDFFSGKWIDTTKKEGESQKVIDVHYGEAGHVTTTIGVLYYLVKALTEYCEEAGEDENRLHDFDLPSMRDTRDFVDVQIPSKSWVQAHDPPIIRPNLTERHWDHLPPATQPPNDVQNCRDVSSSGAMSPPCVFAFLAAQLGTHHRQEALAEFLKGYTTFNNGGWEAQNDFRHGGFQNKLGLVATQPGASMTLSYPDSSQIRVLTMHYLKSYGDAWKDSQLEMRAQVVAAGGEVVHEQVMKVEGYHEQPVSISNTFRTAFTTPVDGEFRLQLKLVGGRMFKINALMFCRESTLRLNL